MTRHFRSAALTGIVSLFVVGASLRSALAVELITLMPVEDTFSREQLPTGTYGTAGAMHVSGATATNPLDQIQGRADSWMKFDLSAAVAQFDSAFGVGNWTLDAVTLSIQESATPTSNLFTRGTGDFSVTWIVNDNWSQGTGSPSGAGTASGNELSWNYGQSIISGADRDLGIFQNAGTNSRQEFLLALQNDFVADLTAGGLMTLRLAPESGDIGFTFNSSNNGSSANRPQLIVSAIPEPATSALLLLAGFAACRRRRRHSGDRPQR